MIEAILGFNFPTAIGILVVFGIGFQVWSWITYSTEFGYAERLRDAIQRFLDQPGKLTPLNSSELLELEAIEPKGMVGTRVREIEIFSDYAGMVALHDLGAVAAETDAGKFRNAFPGTLIASLLVLGLMGTLWSLRSTLGSDELRKFVQKDATVESNEKKVDSETGGSMTTSAFQKALGNVVSGFGDAFLASIFGVGGTIILIGGRVIVRSRREKCFAEIEKLAIEQLLPYYIEPEQTALKRATDMLDAGANHYRDATKGMERQSEQLQASIAELTSSTQEANKVFGPEGAVVYQLSEFTKAANCFNSNSDKVAGSVDKSTTVMQALIVDCNKLLQSLEQKTQEQSERQIAAGKELEGSIRRLEQTAVKSNTALSENITGLVDSNTEIQKSLTQQSKVQLDALNNVTVSLFKRLSGALDSLGEDNELLINGLIKYTNAHNKKSDAIQEELGKTIVGISSSINRLGDTNKEFVDTLVAQSKESSEKRETGLNAFGTQIQELKATVDSFTQSNIQTSNQFMKRLKESDSIHEELGETIKGINSSISGLGEQNTELIDTVVAQNKESSDDLLNRLKESNDKSIPQQKELNELIEKLCEKLDNLKLESKGKEDGPWWARKK